MFTGIVECVGNVVSVAKEGSLVHLWVASPISDSLKVDQSVAHNGVCLTVTEVQPGRHAVTLVEESLMRSHFDEVSVGIKLNLERSLTLNQRLDGHLVQGHVDGTIFCTERVFREGSWHFGFQFEPEKALLLIDKGSVCINGVSLTVIQPGRTSFSVAIIPYTFEHTSFFDLEPGMRCNVEYDLLAKYLVRWKELEAFKVPKA